MVSINKKMSEIICINDLFSPEARQVYEQYGIVTPQQDVYYSVREVVITRYGTGLLLNELVNPKMYCHNIGEVEMWAEVNFKISRFLTVNGQVLTEELLRTVEPKSTRKDLV